MRKIHLINRALIRFILKRRDTIDSSNIEQYKRIDKQNRL